MLRYLRGEVYRLLHKRSMYIYFGILAFAYIALAFIRSASFDAGTIVVDADNLYVYLPALAGGFLFAAIYTDDLNSRNLTTLVGYGLGKPLLVVAKFLLMLLFSAVVYACVVLLSYLTHAAMGWPAGPEALRWVIFTALKHLLATVAWAALASIVVYGLQRTTFAIVVYVLLSLGIVGSLLGAVFQMEFISSVAPDLQTHTMGYISMRITMPLALAEAAQGSSIVQPVVEYTVYLALSIVLSAIAFTRKEMEF
jgi:hypothetical protein